MRCVGILSDKNFWYRIQIYPLWSIAIVKGKKHPNELNSNRLRFQWDLKYDLFGIILSNIYFIDLAEWRKYHRSVYSHVFFSVLLLSLKIRYTRKSLWYFMCTCVCVYTLYAAFIIGIYTLFAFPRASINVEFEHTITCRISSMTVRVWVCSNTYIQDRSRVLKCMNEWERLICRHDQMRQKKYMVCDNGSAVQLLGDTGFFFSPPNITVYVVFAQTFEYIFKL